MKIQILGTGCPKCAQLADHAAKAADELNLEYELLKITNITDIMQFGVMLTPALAVDGTVKTSGSVPSVDEIKKMLT